LRDLIGIIFKVWRWSKIFVRNLKPSLICDGFSTLVLCLSILSLVNKFD
jgi:hypothetical protein